MMIVPIKTLTEHMKRKVLEEMEDTIKVLKLTPEIRTIIYLLMKEETLL